ncbi:uncharacterized protein LOC131947671 [Physella acuta]|uniref:uncharacterized protein LOC131947671 n=1 Tax=Physella acuta TaxID=109671 RepID=UPI0027DDE543|nr:uncharacterized protein LOC131947671 [Physella acuta]
MGSQGTSQVYHSDDKCCRICHDDGGREKLVSPCYCSGSMGFVHVSCLKKWLRLKGRKFCELCSYKFPMVKVYPTGWQYFKILMKTWLLKDILCRYMLLASITLLCIANGMCFEHVGKADTTSVIIMLLVSLLDVGYICLIVRIVFYRRRHFLIWRNKKGQNRMVFDKTPPPIIRNVQDKIHEQAHRAETSRAVQTQEGIPVLLRPGHSRDPTTSLTANGSGNVNINVTHTQLPAGSEFQRVSDGDETDQYFSCPEERLLSNENVWTIPQQNGINNITTTVGSRSSKTHRRRARHRSCGLSLLCHDDLCSAFRVYKPNPNATDIQLPVVQRFAAQDDTDEFFTFHKLVYLCKIARSHKISINEMYEITDVKSKNTNNILSRVVRKGSKTERRMSRHRSRATDKTVGSSTDGHPLVTRSLSLLGHDDRASPTRSISPNELNHRTQPTNPTIEPNQRTRPLNPTSQSLVTRSLSILGHDDLCSAFRVYKPNPNATDIQLPVVQRVAAQDDTAEFFTFPKPFFLCKENACSHKISKNTNNVRKVSKTERQMSRHRSRDKKVGSSTDGQSLVTRAFLILGHDDRTSAFKFYKPK